MKKDHAPIIYVDANILIDLVHPVSRSFKKPGNGISQYWQILDFLNQAGCHIVITDAVMAECHIVRARKMSDLQDYFQPGAYAYKGREELHKFLVNALYDGYPNIEYVEGFGEEKVVEALRNLRTFANSHVSKRDLPQLQKRLRQLPEHAGENAIMHHYLHLSPEQRRRAIILTDDKNASIDMEACCPGIAICNLRGLLEGIGASGLHTHMGLKEAISADSLIYDLRMKEKQVHNSIVGAFTDTDHFTINGDGFVPNTHHGPFYKAMVELAKECQAKKVSYTPNLHAKTNLPRSDLAFEPHKPWGKERPSQSAVARLCARFNGSDSRGVF